MQSSFASIAYENPRQILAGDFSISSNPVLPAEAAGLRPSKQKMLVRPHPTAFSASNTKRQPFPRTLPTAPDGAGKRPQAPARPTHRLPHPIIHRLPIVIPGLTRNLGQVSTKSPFYAFFLDTCRRFGLFSPVFRGRCPLLLHQWPILWTPVRPGIRAVFPPGIKISQFLSDKSYNPLDFPKSVSIFTSCCGWMATIISLPPSVTCSGTDCTMGRVPHRSVIPIARPIICSAKNSESSPRRASSLPGGTSPGICRGARSFPTTLQWTGTGC